MSLSTATPKSIPACFIFIFAHGKQFQFKIIIIIIIARVNIIFYLLIYTILCITVSQYESRISARYQKNIVAKKSVPFNSSILNKWIQVSVTSIQYSAYNSWQVGRYHESSKSWSSCGLGPSVSASIVNCLLHFWVSNASRGGSSSGPEEPRRCRKHIYQDCCSEASPPLSPRQLRHTAQGSREAVEQDEPKKTMYNLCSKQSLHPLY